jgi:hypothetical protein
MARIPSFNTISFFFFGKISSTGDKKNPVQPLGKNFKKELPKHLPYFLEKKKKKKNLPNLDSESV